MTSNSNAFVIVGIYSLTNNLPLLVRNVQDTIMAVDYESHRFSFEAPRGTCVMGHLLSLDGVLTINNQQIPFLATGKITQIIPLEESMAKYSVNLYRHDTVLWAQFKQHLEAEQSKVDQLFRSMRDEE